MILKTNNHCKAASRRFASGDLVRPLGVLLILAALLQTGCVGLTGASSSQDVTFTPTTVDFGQIAVRSKKTVSVTLKNGGAAPVILPQATITGSAFSFSGLALPATLAPGDVLTFSATFAPTAVGTAAGTIAVSSDDAGLPPASLALTGLGLNSNGPTITSQPTSQTVTMGQSANFSVTATGTGTLSYQWKKNASSLSGATAASYTTAAATTSDSGAQFTVVVTDTAGSATSNAATLTVTAAAVAPAITTQPTTQTITSGQTATFSVVASGTSPISYQWRKNGANIAGATSSSYTTPAATSADSGSQYTVVVTNAAGGVTSNAATLTVNTPVVITGQPANQTVTAGQTASFAVSATSSLPMTFQWRRNGANISGATAASYTTPATTTADNGVQFSVVVTSAAGSVASNNATLTVTAAPVAPSITTQPVNRTVVAGQTATFSVTASGTNPMTYQWRHNGANIGGATAASYTTPATSAADDGAQFSVFVSNSAGNATSAAATLTVNSPVTITSQPANQSVVAGQTATFSVTANGTSPISYQWRKNGGNISGATGSSYAIAAAVTGDSGAQITVVVSNPAGSVTSGAATLTVTAAPVAPSITSQPSNQTVAVGQTAIFSVTASGTAPLTYQWKKDGVDVGGATSATYTTPVTGAADDGGTFSAVVTNSLSSAASGNATLTVVQPVTITSQPVTNTVALGQTATFTVTATGSGPLSYQWRKNGANISGAAGSSYTTPATTSGDNGAQFSVVVSNSVGSVTSSAVALTVNTPPAITSQPASRTLVAGQTATFSVTATGTGPLSYQWRKGGSNINGATSATYTTPATTTADSGAQFTVVVTNSVGNVTSNGATLTVNAATLLLSANPTSLSFGSVTVGSSKVLAVTISNTGNSSVTISGVSQSGPGFSAAGVSSGLILNAGQTATLNVTFAPTSAGSAAGSISVASNGTNSPAAIGLTGSGAQPVQHSATLTWNAASGIAGYFAYRGTSSTGPFAKLNSAATSSTTFSDSTVQAGQNYFYAVTAVDSNGTESGFSNSIGATIPTP